MHTQGADRYFIGLPSGGSASWSEASNWSGGTLPLPQDVARITFDDPFDRVVTLDVDASLSGLRLANGGGGLMTLYQPSDANLSTSYESVGAPSLGNSRGEHVQDGGTNNVGSLTLGDYSYYNTTSGRYVLNDGTLNVSQLGIGLYGKGTFEQNGGAVNVSNILTIADFPQSTGAYLLRGGTVNSSGWVYVGYHGAGTFIHSAGTHRLSGILSLGVTQAYGEVGGTYVLSGAHAVLVTDDELIARHGPGTFLQSAGTHEVSSRSVIGWANPGIYDLSGGSLRVGELLELGVGGRGTLNHSGGIVTVGTKAMPGIMSIRTYNWGTYSLGSSEATLNVWGTEYVGYEGRGTFRQ
ncbi:hypothetical protein [Fontivita pretiosa]|uniref:hypothetical protein n=1 Tax=Fontivita pretiosa TaxID=2989684 RepID=UPI003D181015